MIVVLTTYPASKKLPLESLAQEIVNRQLAACVQIGPTIDSCYVWQGKTCMDSEIRVMLKTTKLALPLLQRFVHEHHPYETPQWVVLSATASAAYSKWLGNGTITI